MAIIQDFLEVKQPSKAPCLGWNIYQRKWFKNQQLPPDEWTREIHSCASAWGRLSSAGREPFNAEAAFEQSLREESRHEPFVRKEDVTSAPASAQLGKKALAHVSQARTVATFSKFQAATSESFNYWNGGVSDCDGCLRLDHINVKMEFTELEEKWQQAINGPVEPVSCKVTDLNDSSCHHQVCHELHGSCCKSEYVKLAGQYVGAMHRALTDGPLSVQVNII